MSTLVVLGCSRVAVLSILHRRVSPMLVRVRLARIIIIIIMNYRSDGKRADGLTLILCCVGRSHIWDVTVSCTTANSYLEASSREAGAAAELAASNKVVSMLDSHHRVNSS